MLELNPVAMTEQGAVSVVGAMAEIDDNALFRHPTWAANSEDVGRSDGRQPNHREQQVRAANRQFPGASVRYTELDGDIGLMVSGGGAGLLQHDLVLAAGEHPSCHTDHQSNPHPDKPAALIEAILANPRTRGLLIGFNYLQLARCDLTVEALLLALDRYRQGYPQLSRGPAVVRTARGRGPATGGPAPGYELSAGGCHVGRRRRCDRCRRAPRP